jgi:hypothetical protein
MDRNKLAEEEKKSNTPIQMTPDAMQLREVFKYTREKVKIRDHEVLTR